MGSKCCIPLPETIGRLVTDSIGNAYGVHPGLILDKFAATWDKYTQEQKLGESQATVIEDIIKHSADFNKSVFSAAKAQRNDMLRELGAATFTAATAGPLTLHLARASALENAGICFHHVHGFVYFPGSGLKGLARAFAELHADAADKNTIGKVFGSAAEKNEACAGSVVFHDAWPQSPNAGLHRDISNVHHAKYYENKGKAPHIPADWEDPVPVSFMAVAANVRFDFALSLRQGCHDTVLLEKALQWLKSGLAHLGAGAKTSAGYGRFVIEDAAPLKETKEELCIWEDTVRLSTPAFLAGAMQKQEDCSLRGATLRGQLRWWWRTMHAAHMSSHHLALMEEAVWGSPQQGSAVSIILENKKGFPQHYDIKVKDKNAVKPDFAKEHGLKEPPDKKTTQGLLYLSYGMAEKSEPRHFMSPSATWVVRVHCRSVGTRGSKEFIEAEDVREQVRMSLRLLCTFGGVGSKSRKGFGSLNLEQNLSGDALQEGEAVLEAARRAGSLFRGKYFSSRQSVPQVQRVTAALDGQYSPKYKCFHFADCPQHDPWFVLDWLGYAVQLYAKKYAHKECKVALGLPRNIDKGTALQHPLAKELGRERENMRDPSPLHFHVAEAEQGMLVRVLAFPSPWLEKSIKSAVMLDEMLMHLEEQARSFPTYTGRHQHAQPVTPPVHAYKPRPKRDPGMAVRVRIVSAGAGKKGNGYRVVEEGREKEGVLTLGTAPPDVQIGATYTAYIKDDSPTSLQYTWDAPAPPRNNQPQGRR